jgi:hypothetical protein
MLPMMGENLATTRQHQRRIGGGSGEQQPAHRLERKADQKKRPPPSFFRMKSNPGRENGDRHLRNYDQARHPDGSVTASRRGEIFPHHRQHGRIGKLKQNRRSGEQNERGVFGEREDAGRGHNRLATSLFAA